MHEHINNMIIEHGNIDHISQTCRQNNQSKLTMQSNREESILEQQRKMDDCIMFSKDKNYIAKMEARRVQFYAVEVEGGGGETGDGK